MDKLPEPDFQPDDIDQVINHYRRPIVPEKKKALMEKLAAQKERFVETQQGQDQSQDLKKDQGRKR